MYIYGNHATHIYTSPILVLIYLSRHHQYPQERSSGVIESSINILKNFINDEKNENEVKSENLDVYNVDKCVHRNFMRHRRDDSYGDENHIDIDKMNNDHIHAHNTHNDDHNIHDDENNDKLENKEKKLLLNNVVQMENNGHRLGGIEKGEQDIENNQYLSENIYYVLARQTLIKGLDSNDVRDLKNNRTGLPAYDKNKLLLGFCEESRDSNNTTTIGMFIYICMHIYINIGAYVYMIYVCIYILYTDMMQICIYIHICR
jgi:hypothetical protein